MDSSRTRQFVHGINNDSGALSMTMRNGPLETKHHDVRRLR
jgi:hypothetical protein